MEQGTKQSIITGLATILGALLVPLAAKYGLALTADQMTLISTYLVGAGALIFGALGHWLGTVLHKPTPPPPPPPAVMLLLLPFVAVLVMLVGCDSTPVNNVVEQVAIQEAAAAAIQANCSTTATQTLAQCYAARASKIELLANVLETVTVGTTLAALQTAVNDAIEKMNLTPEEATPIVVLADALLTDITPSVTSNAITAQALAAIQQVSGWVSSEARLYVLTSVRFQH